MMNMFNQLNHRGAADRSRWIQSHGCSLEIVIVFIYMQYICRASGGNVYKNTDICIKSGVAPAPGARLAGVCVGARALRLGQCSVPITDLISWSGRTASLPDPRVCPQTWFLPCGWTSRPRRTDRRTDGQSCPHSILLYVIQISGEKGEFYLTFLSILCGHMTKSW